MGDSRGGGGGGGGEPDLGGDVELVDEADLLGELLAGVRGHVLAHQLQELRGFEAATVHLSGSGRAGSRISTAEWKWRDWRREMRAEDEGGLFGFVGNQYCSCGKEKAGNQRQLQPPPSRRAGLLARHAHATPVALDLGFWVGGLDGPALSPSGWLAVGSAKTVCYCITRVAQFYSLLLQEGLLS